MSHIAIVGAGLSGISCAETLRTHGHRVTLFDKGRGPGGRMASRRIETPLGIATFDFGAQYFTVRDERFAFEVREWERAGLIQPWPAAGPDALIGVPNMNSILKHLLARQEVHFSALVKGLKREGRHWRLLCEGHESSLFDDVVLALPAEQTAPILTLHDFDLAQAALFARSQPCWTGMFVFPEPVRHNADIIRDQGLIGWAARDNAKPGRSGPERWVVQARPQWSVAHLEDASEIIAPHLLEALAAACNGSLPDPIAQSIHRWRYGLSAGTGAVCLLNAELNLGACGDWLLGHRLEDAWISGRSLAKKMIAEK